MAEQRGVIAAAGPLIAFSRIGTLRSVTMDMAHWPPGFEKLIQERDVPRQREDGRRKAD